VSKQFPLFFTDALLFREFQPAPRPAGDLRSPIRIKICSGTDDEPQVVIPDHHACVDNDYFLLFMCVRACVLACVCVCVCV